jgi:tetratricopeptide (TPR) repeat protein
MPILMSAGQDSPPISPKRRRWSVAPAPAPPAAAFEGYAFFRELPNVSGLLLFRWFRDVILWVGSSPRHRQGLFREATDPELLAGWACDNVEEALRSPARVFADLTLSPATISEEEIIGACIAVAIWAGEQGNTAAAAAFYDAAAWVQPLDPEHAYRAGLGNRRNAAYGRSKSWFQRGIGIARRTANWPSYVLIYLAWGNLEIIRGREVEARALLMKGFKAASKYNLRDLSARAQHDLFMLAVQQDDYSGAYQHAHLALQLYPRDNPFFPYLVHDLAQTWACQRFGSVALPLLLVVRSIISGHEMEIAGNVAGAAGLVGNRDLFDQASDEVCLRTTKAIPKAASALISVAEGAFALRLIGQAIEFGERALKFAIERQEVSDEKRARELLDRLRRGDRIEPVQPPELVQHLATLLMKELPMGTEP